MMSNVIAYIGLGSNLNQPAQQLAKAIAAIKTLPHTRFVACSSYYRSKAVTLSDNDSVPDYLNAVVSIKTQLDALGLLDALQEIETAQGRVRTEKRWEARPLDLDILLYGNDVINNERLKIPHIEMTKRDFVLMPLSEIAPLLNIPEYGKATGFLTSCQQTILEKTAFTELA